MGDGKLNVLLTSVGRRSYLVNYFKAALGKNGRVVGANMFSNTAGMAAADVAVVAPPSRHPEYVPFLEDVCRQYDIGLLCSLHDLDVYMLSQNQEWLTEAGIAHTLPTADWGRISLDKYECTKLLQEHGFPVPATAVSLDGALEAIRNDEMHFPVIVKVRTGFGSLGLARCNSETELRGAYHAASDHARASDSHLYIPMPDDQLVLVQEAIGGREVCVGIVNDLQGAYHAHFACEVHAMRSGESDWATSLAREPYTEVARRFSELTRHKGIWGVDFMERKGVYVAIDVNPRFTGDYPFHHLAGADIPRALVAWACGDQPLAEYFSARPGVTGFKDLVPTTCGAESQSSAEP